MDDFIAKIESTRNASVFLTQSEKEIFAFNGVIEEVIVDDEDITIDLNQCQVTINRLWTISEEDETDFIFDCGNEVCLYLNLLN